MIGSLFGFVWLDFTIAIKSVQEVFRERSSTQNICFSLPVLLAQSASVEGFLWDCVMIEVVEDKGGLH